MSGYKLPTARPRTSRRVKRFGTWDGYGIQGEPLDPSSSVTFVIAPGRWTYVLTKGVQSCVRAGDWVIAGDEFQGVIVTETRTPEAVGVDFTQPIPTVSGDELTIVNPDGTESRFGRAE